MHAKFFRPHQYFSNPIGVIISILLLSLFIPRHNAKSDSKLYEACYNMTAAPCGKPISWKLDYPFWVEGVTRSDCGLEEYKLSCEDEDLVVNIGSNNKYRVVGINPSTSVLTLNHSNDILKYICDSSNPPIEYPIFYDELYDYKKYTEFLDLLYHCGDDIQATEIESNFTCPYDLKSHIYLFPEINSLSQAQKDKLDSSCFHTILPVSIKVLEKVITNLIERRQLIFDGSFEVHCNNTNEKVCLDCVSNGGLCWSGTTLTSNDKCLYQKSGSNQKKTGMIIGIGGALGGALGGAILLLLSVLIIYCYRKKTKHGSFLFSQNVSSHHKDVDAFLKQYGSSIPQRYRYSTIKRITNYFKDELGKGGYGNVYRGSLPDGRDVAVKVLNATKGNGEEFINEVASIGRTSHVNVVTLLGFCYEGEKRALIYEFMPNGSLEKFIHGTTPLLEGQHLGWEKLFSIAIGIARGLEYLHRGCNTRILHFDIKPHNILLDKDFRPKISDFGHAKLYAANESVVSSLLQARGTIGYIAPEVTSRNFGQVSHKSDVYSYGMMILEMVGGRKNVNARADHTSEIYYPRWLYKRIQFGDVLNFANEISEEENEHVRKMVIVGLWCIQIYPSQRPSISKVIEMLEGQTAALEIPPSPYLCSVPSSPSNSKTKRVLCPPSGTEPTPST